MRAETIIARTGAAGFPHAVRVHVELLPHGGYSARVVEEVMRRRPNFRTGEQEWDHTHEREFTAGQSIALSTRELEEVRETIGSMQTLCRRTKQELAGT